MVSSKPFTVRHSLDYLPIMLEEGNEYSLGRHGRRLYAALELIGWDLIHRGCGDYGLLNHKKEEQCFTLYGSGESCKLEMDRGGERSGDQAHLYIELSQCDIGTIDGASITLTVKGTKNVYVFFPNFDLEEKDRKKAEADLKELKSYWAKAHESARKAGVIN